MNFYRTQARRGSACGLFLTSAPSVRACLCCVHAQMEAANLWVPEYYGNPDDDVNV